ncbi:VOC family protein [Yoonia sp. SS1-5]|uniref:VOC family protein n=1 Tax=Yoonia rhodophyticola TaxID=3137370 RepID=A0AAN0NJT4_9RHOB
MTPSLTQLDHLVLTVRDIDATVAFYTRVLGMTSARFTAADGTTRWALKFGRQKINLHAAAAPFEPKAGSIQPGSADLCFLSDTGLADWQRHFADLAVDVLDGPVQRTGAAGPILSIYIRDPDGNLIEVSNAL